MEDVERLERVLLAFGVVGMTVAFVVAITAYLALR